MPAALSAAFLRASQTGPLAGSLLISAAVTTMPPAAVCGAEVGAGVGDGFGVGEALDVGLAVWDGAADGDIAGSGSSGAADAVGDGEALGVGVDVGVGFTGVRSPSAFASVTTLVSAT